MRRLACRGLLRGASASWPERAASRFSAAAAAPSRVLADRTLIHVHGDEARKFLQGLITNDVEGLARGSGMYCHLLNAKGRTMFEAFVAAPRVGAAGVTADAPESGEGGDASSFLLDCHVDVAKRLTRHLKMHKLRAKVKVESLAATHEVRWRADGSSTSDAASDAASGAAGETVCEFAPAPPDAWPQVLREKDDGLRRSE